METPQVAGVGVRAGQQGQRARMGRWREGEGGLVCVCMCVVCLEGGRLAMCVRVGGQSM